MKMYTRSYTGQTPDFKVSDEQFLFSKTVDWITQFANPTTLSWNRKLILDLLLGNLMSAIFVLAPTSLLLQPSIETTLAFSKNLWRVRRVPLSPNVLILAF